MAAVNIERRLRVLALFEEHGALTTSQIRDVYGQRNITDTRWMPSLLRSLVADQFLEETPKKYGREAVYRRTERACSRTVLEMLHPDPQPPSVRMPAMMISGTSDRSGLPKVAASRREVLERHVERFLAQGGQIKDLPGPPERPSAHGRAGAPNYIQVAIATGFRN